MTDDEITNALQEVGAAWLMDQDDEACQTNALRHLVAAAMAKERERCAKLVEPPKNCEPWEIRCGEEGIELLRDLAALIRRA